MVVIGQLFNSGISYEQGTHESSENPKFIHLLSFIPTQILKVHIKPESSNKKKIPAAFDKKGKLLKPFPCRQKPLHKGFLTIFRIPEQK
ncbi:hypothetical protein ASG66_15025 [Bacillus sp. Leaf406]|nr:hypothetical protein ASG66_15025 [Bacillus sp. Leaf406]